MADIRVEIKGDSSGAQQAMQQAGAGADDLGEQIGKSSAKWEMMAAAATKAADAVISFVKDSIQEYAKAERVQAQLARAAGEYTQALSDQADALSKANNVEDETIKQSEMLLTQWGGVAAASKETEQAVLDYAAAMGTDVVSATQDVIRNVESGGKALAKMGIQIEATGDRGKDLALVVEALNKKFGGAAEAEANTLHGRITGLDVAFGNFKEELGGVFAEMEKDIGIASRLTSVISTISDFVAQHKQGIKDTLTVALSSFSPVPFTALNAVLGETKDAAEALAVAQKSLSEAPAVKGLTDQGAKDAEQAAKDAARSRAAREKAAEDEREKYFAIQQEQKAGEQRLAEEQSRAEEYSINLSKEQTKALEEELKKRGEVEKKAADDAASARKKALDKEAADLKHQQQAWSSAAEQIGAAFVSSLTEQLNKLASGGEFDAALFVGEILAATISVAGSVIGSALGQPALGSAIGNLAAMGVRAGAGAISAENHKKAGTSLPKYHDGGWVGGAQEQVALLREKERVLTPEEVTRMGGPASVDALAMGGGRSLSAGSRTINLNVSAVDAKSVKELFSGDGSRGMREAVRTGQGALPKLLRVNPR